MNSKIVAGCEFTASCVRVAARAENGAAGGFVSQPIVTADHSQPTPVPIAEPPALAAAFRAALAAARVRRARAVLSLPSNYAVFKTLRLAPMPDTELLSAAHWKLATETGLDPQTITSQLVAAWPVNEGGKQKREVLAVAVKNEDVERYVDVVAETGLTVSAVDLSTRAIVRSIARASGGGQAKELLLHLEQEFAAMAVTAAGRIQYMRIFQGGLRRLRELVVQPPDSARVPEESPAQVHGASGRDLAREVALADHYYEQYLNESVPDSGLIVACEALPPSVVESLSRHCGLSFAVAPPPAGCGADAAGGAWHAAVGLSLYHAQDLGLREAA